jgi:trk system potassium uptake protein
LDKKKSSEKTRQAIVIGLGQFGMAVARALAERRVEVLAVDRREERVREAAAFVTNAVVFDATDADALAQTSPGRREVSVCAIGDEAREASIICTALLRQMGSPRVIARASNELHARILSLVGAHEVVNPEREFGERFANRIIYTEIVGELPLGEDLVITELKPPESFIGYTLSDLQLPKRYGITVVAMRRPGRPSAVSPDPNEALEREDILVVVSHRSAIAQLIERV